MEVLSKNGRQLSGTPLTDAHNDPSLHGHVLTCLSIALGPRLRR